MKAIRLACICYILIVCTTSAQEEPSDSIAIGKPFPSLTLKNLINYKAKNVDISELRGKWVILDFWSATCGTCIGSLPKLDTMQRRFKEDMNLILIGWNDGEATLKSFKKFSAKYKVKLTIALDSDPFKRFNIWGVPTFVVIDPNGTTQAILTYAEFTEPNVLQIISGNGKPVLKEKPTVKFDAFEPFLVNGNAGEDDDFMYRSMLMQWKKDIPATGVTHVNASYGNLIQVSGVPLEKLYFMAYQDTLYPYSVASYARHKSSYGKYWLHPILELSDSSEFQWKPGEEENVFCYSLRVPEHAESSLEMQKIMQRDLKSYFGYQVTVEKRMMPCWKVVATETAKRKLLSKRDSTQYNDYHFLGFKYYKVPMQDLINKLWWNFQLEPQFVDATGITEKVDIELDADMTNFNEVREALNKIGLQLVKGKSEFKVIVIRDKTSS